MAESLKIMERFQPGAPWNKLRRVDWGADRAAFAHWMQDLLVDCPLSPRIKGLWFAAPEFGQGSEIWVTGGVDFDSDGESNEWACDAVWPPDAKRAGVRALRSAVLAAVDELVGETRQDLCIGAVEHRGQVKDDQAVLRPELVDNAREGRGANGKWEVVSRLAKGQD